MARTAVAALSVVILCLGFLFVAQQPLSYLEDLPQLQTSISKLSSIAPLRTFIGWLRLYQPVMSLPLRAFVQEDPRLHVKKLYPGIVFPKDYAVCTATSAGGKVYTSDPANPQASCMLVEDGLISYVGSQGDVVNHWRERNPGTSLSIYEKENATIIPGMIDSHAHTLQWGYMSQLPLSGSRSIREIVQKLEDYVRSHPDVAADKTRWIRGLGWDQTRFTEGRWPTAADLASSPLLADRFIALERVDVHASWVSQAVIDLLPNPLPMSDDEIEKKGGKVLRNEDGILTGVFIDNAQSLLPIPPASPAQKAEWFEIAAKDALSVGLTGIHDAWVDSKDINFYMTLATESKLPIRMYLMAVLPQALIPAAKPFSNADPAQEWPNIPRLENYGPQGHLTLRAVKLFADGALGSFGAALLEPYSDDSSTSGLLLTAPEDLKAQVSALYDRGWQVNTHAIGDRANKVILDIYEELISDVGSDLEHQQRLAMEDWRPRIEHAQIMRLEDLERTGRLGVIPSVQPTHATSDMGYAESRLGSKRIKGAYAYATLLHATRDGVMPLGSDFPVEGINPLLGFYAAVTRLDVSGNSPNGSAGWYPEQKLSREEALRGMTSSAAYASFAENSHGILRPGMKADFVFLDRDIMTVPAADILGTKVLATVVDGQIAYEAFE